MADINLLAPKIAKWEGGYVNDPADHGGATNMGITLATWQKVGYDKNHDGHIDASDIKLLDKVDFSFVLRRYWDSWKADKIAYQATADILVDWVWGSGKYGISIPQGMLGVPVDGIVGDATIAALNGQDPVAFHQRLYEARVAFLQHIVVNNPSQKRFIHGWLNRLADFR